MDFLASFQKTEMLVMENFARMVQMLSGYEQLLLYLGVCRLVTVGISSHH